MTRTLADMTPAEQQECVGRWAEVRRRLVIIAEIDERHGDATVFRVETQNIEWHFLPDLTPRLDLPRAWTPTGEPVPMSVEMGEGWDDETNSPAHWPVPIADCCDCERPDMRPTHHRFVTDWEVAP